MDSRLFFEHFTLKRHPKLVNPSVGDGDGYVTVVGDVMGHFGRTNYLITFSPKHPGRANLRLVLKEGLS